MPSSPSKLGKLLQKARSTPSDETKKSPSASGKVNDSTPSADTTAVMGEEAQVAFDVTSSSDPVPKPVVVLDGSNVAWEYRSGAPISSKAIKIALDYYWESGKPAVALLPRNLVDTRLPKEKQADDVNLLLQLQKIGRVAFIPAGTHDDYYILQYATRENAQIVSNDRFRDHVSFQASSRRQKLLERFLCTHLIPFTFVGNVFLPNPHPRHIGKLTQRGRYYHDISYKARITKEANKIKEAIKGQ